MEMKGAYQCDMSVPSQMYAIKLTEYNRGHSKIRVIGRTRITRKCSGLAVVMMFSCSRSLHSIKGCRLYLDLHLDHRC